MMRWNHYCSGVFVRFVGTAKGGDFEIDLVVPAAGVVVEFETGESSVKNRKSH